MTEKDEDILNTSIGEDLSDEEENELNTSVASSTSDSGLEKKARLQTPSPHRRSSPATSPRRALPAFMVAASPPKFMSLEQVMEAANGVKNMALAHEIAVDSNFKLEKLEKPQNSIEKQVTDIMHKAFWDAFEEHLKEDPPDYSHAVILIGEVKENLMKILLPQHVRMRTQICEVLDLDLIKQKMENDAFDIYYYSEYVVSIMAKLCAPVRDDRVAKLKEIKDIVPLFKEIFEVLDLMKMDMANFTIQQIRPYLQQQSVEYERKKFQEFLTTQQETGIDGLEFTKHWLKRNFDKLAESEDFNTEGASASPMATPAAILNEAYMEILQWDDSQIFPETLIIDQGRFLDVRDKTSRLTLVASILLVTYGTVGASIQGVQSLKEKMKSEICTILEGVTDSELANKMTNIAEQISKTVDEYLVGHGFTALTPDKHRLLTGQISQLSDKQHTVYKLMANRLMDFIKQIISKKHTEPLKVPPGYSVVERELGQCCGQFLRLISHNRSVFFTYYSDIVNTLLQWKVGDISPRG